MQAGVELDLNFSTADASAVFTSPTNKAGVAWAEPTSMNTTLNKTKNTKKIGLLENLECPPKQNKTEDMRRFQYIALNTIQLLKANIKNHLY